MEEQLLRTAMLVGEEGVERLKNAKVALFGLGGVGGYTAEALARAGIGTMYLCDNDTISLSNLNRQILATYDTIGRLKTDVAKERIASINRDIEVICDNTFVLEENLGTTDWRDLDYAVDAIDTVSGKIALIEQADRFNVPIISCMGTGNKMRADMLEIADIYDTSVCPLARVVRKELKNRGIGKCKVVFSKEGPHKTLECDCVEKPEGKSSIPASNSFVPAVAGLLIAQEVIRGILVR